MSASVVLVAPAADAGGAADASEARYFRPELDGLRWFAAFAVFVFHAWTSPEVREATNGSKLLSLLVYSGALGVPVFFTLSSFLITELLLREHALTGRIDPKAFYIRRALRIWPLYYAFLFCALALHLVWPVTDWRWSHYLALLTFLGNWSMFFSGTMTRHFTSVLWSVCVEEQFYLVWPFVLRWVTTKRILALCVVLVLLGFGSRLAILAAWPAVRRLDASTFSQLEPIAAGAALCVWMRRSERLRTLRTGARVLLIVVGALGLLSNTALYLISKDTARVLGGPMMALSAGAILCGVLHSEGCIASLFTHPWFVYLGKISYGIYVTHVACLALARRIVDGRLLLSQVAATPLVALLALVLTIAVSSLSYQLVEKPFLVLKRRFSHVVSRPP